MPAKPDKKHALKAAENPSKWFCSMPDDKVVSEFCANCTNTTPITNNIRAPH